ncbi:methyl-accepting chemotaxis protein [Marinicauda pacifica]|jgi:polyhydroxyalkanoate synthesis repressor PhaR|uniref:Polyhydroxyalkanoate synthesis repressor PhaR n=1 Tax=Marinicauda pacifica TaxID=1133559 RepID=A0A4S2H9M3_9PROT|nr:polyhydroxyalkanoate synthesis repressor PhaR [Marinicauda pacifica]TGY92152.1 polyhydroxyalkanoate synthesis repressor PhaR [Marinicauda pacifica]GGE46412.1 methyl-accepting chemotaxis protein [Marinicauda pacifica]
MAQTGDVIIIKKYANRRLYDTSASRYVTLEHLRDLVRAGKDFQVVDAKSGDDLTRSVLGQIIFEQESKGENLLPVEFLRQVIGFYGDSMQSFVPEYLRLTMETLSRQQDAIKDKLSGTSGNNAPALTLLEEQARRNMAMFEQAMSMFTPFTTRSSATPANGSAEPAQPASGDKDEVKALRQELDAMRAKLDRLAGE